MIDQPAVGDDGSAPMPGDELITEPHVSNDRAVSLGAPRDDVFAWLAQMGFGRAGWYSYDWIDNLGRRSADRLNPEWQVAAAGEQMPGGPIAFDVTHLRRPDHLVLAVLDRRLPGHRLWFTLAYRLEPIGSGGGATNLTTRARIRTDGPLGRAISVGLGLGDGVMVRRQLRGLVARCGVAPGD
jgi:hypothetical protein